MQMRDDQAAEPFDQFRRLRSIIVLDGGRDPYQRAAGRSPQKGLHGNQTLLYPIVGREGVPDLEPVDKDLRDASLLYRQAVHLDLFIPGHRSERIMDIVQDRGPDSSIAYFRRMGYFPVVLGINSE